MKQALHWTPQGHRERRGPKSTWKRDLETEMWRSGFKYGWRTVDDRAVDKWSMAYVSLKGKGPILDVALIHDNTCSGGALLQSRKWQLIGMSQ